MWTVENRPRYNRDRLRYPSDMTDDEWALIAPLVERTFAWLNRCRRLAKDFENRTRNALAFLKLASIRMMMRKLCNH
jgi:transposase